MKQISLFSIFPALIGISSISIIPSQNPIPILKINMEFVELAAEEDEADPLSGDHVEHAAVQLAHHPA